MKRIFSKSDVKKIYNDLYNNGHEQEADSMLLVLMYMNQNNIFFSNYLLKRDIVSIDINKCKNFSINDIPNWLSGIISKNIISSRNTFYFPNFFIQGFLCSYYLDLNGNKDELRKVIRDYSNYKDKRSNYCFIQFCKGVISYFAINYKINEIHEYLHILTNRTYKSEKNPDRSYNVDLFSVWLLLTFKKSSIWDIDKSNIKEVIRILSKSYNSWVKNKECNLNEISIGDIFNCKFSEIINWWRAAFLGHECRKSIINPLEDPPKRKINYKTLFEPDNIENRLKYSMSLLKDDLVKNEIIEVYKNRHLQESHNLLVYGKINSFIKYYNYCLEYSLNYTETVSVKKYVDEKSYGKENKSKNQLINNLRGYFKLAIKIGYYENLRSNPVSYLLNVTSDKFSKIPDDKVIPEKDVKKIFMIEDKLSKFERLFIRLLYYTGLRVGEALLLTVGCIVKITDRAVTIIVPPFKQRKEPYVILVEDLDVIKVLEGLIDLRSKYGRVPHFETGEAKLWIMVEVKSNGRGLQHISKKRGNQIIEKACKLAGIKKYTNHCFRHTFAHRKLNDENYDYEDVAILLGHSCLDTLVIYSRLTNEEKLRFFSGIIRRKKAVSLARQEKKSNNVNEFNGKYKIRLSNYHNRWCGSGWCNTDETVKCPKRFISHYTCPLFKSDVSRKDEIIDDYYANIRLLEHELSKQYPILKDVVLFKNILDGIIENLNSIDIDTKNLILVGEEIIREANNFIKRMIVR
ncbi:tyrosine-type recombinase/integrase [Clostridium sp. DJ247]|uniref:tyrosine-type recombinase/integrase n=1 Tax=Clostridium sp. DJ247 TaxID=2726188 RepID=UPI001624BF98|nr:tyrosine-type recombinase/integrase [Clostridium sp. DJ247]MBC2579865.1 phage integrase family protein [Clostridium sp. DJ247]